MNDNVLNMTDKLMDKVIKDMILNIEGLSPEELKILLEDYQEKYRDVIEYEDVRKIGGE